MNALQHIDKFLRKHNARLMIDTHHEAKDIILSIPAQIDPDGTIARYAMEYRLGAQFPQPAPSSAERAERESPA